jgi:cell wall-associated NlpC family hydrolase
MSVLLRRPPPRRRLSLAVALAFAGVSVQRQIDGAPGRVEGAGTAGQTRLSFPWRRVALAALAAAVAGAVVALVVPASSRSHHVARTASLRVAGAERFSAKATKPPHKVALASTRPVAEVRDPEEAKSFPVAGTVHHASAATPAKVAEEFVAPGAQSNAEVRAELNRMHQVESAARAQAQAQATVTTVPGGDSVDGNGTIPIPAGIPEVVQRVIAGANAIADFPYVYGGGHASFVSNSYDCSGSVSYALAAGGLLSEPETSGQLESWGEPGPGRWITVYANAGHVYMYVNVGGRWMRFDTVGRSGPYASRWQPEIRSNAGFVARHWPGL